VTAVALAVVAEAATVVAEAAAVLVMAAGKVVVMMVVVAAAMSAMVVAVCSDWGWWRQQWRLRCGDDGRSGGGWVCGSVVLALVMEVLVVVATAVVASEATLVSARDVAVSAKFVAEVVLWYHYLQGCGPFYRYVFCKHFLSPLLT
jgi:hypothetical protein